MKQALSIEQMKHLKELGLDTSDASMVLIATDDDGCKLLWEDAEKAIKHHWYNVHFNLYYVDTSSYDHSLKEECGVFTLQDILGKLPRHINDFGTKNKLHIEPTFAGPWCISYQIGICEPFVFELSENLLDVAYEMLCWCIEKGYVKVGMEEK